MRNKIILIATILLTIVCTIVVYILLFEEQNALFYINVGIACFAEIILLANIPILSSGKLLTIKNASLSISLNLFAIVIFLWTTGCSLLMKQDGNLKILYIGLLIIITILFVINGAIIIIASEVAEKQAKNIQSTIENKKIFSIAIDSYWIETRNGLENINSDWKDKTLQSFKIVLDKISMIPSNKLDKHSDIANELTRELNEIHDLFQKVATEEETSEFQSCITLKISHLKNYIQTIKSSL
ncbi:hypothetical protein [Bacteroides sp. GM023]|uniref:hypothetical protein n=1 Tax=Bacteroides sp. GM023 TaxID=2723058 RepID=UPI00168BFB26|nr:hypothetical protein [Bacteroides sp. GM023]MBD3589511.1 hypothetical protein [Bacteroides sp. GM023]